MSRISDLAGFSTSLSSTQDLSVGVITATTFSGDGSGLTGVASTDNIQTATDAKFLANVNITGVATASSFVGDGSALTGIDATAIKDSGGNVKAQANPAGVVVTGVLTATTGSFDGNVTIGGTLTYQDVTNIDSIGIITAQQGIQVLANGINVTGVVTATSFEGDGSGLTGVGVGTEDNINTSGIITATRFVGSGTSLVFAPKIIAFNPLALQQNVAVGSSIHITFDQNIHFVGSGDVVIREGSSDGTGIQTFSISSGAAPSGLSIVDTQLIIEPSSDFSFSTSIYVTLPSTGIANTEGDFFAGSSNYNFRTSGQTFTAQGGDLVYTRADPGSPTNYYKYHIFASRTGILTTSAPSASATDLQVLMVAGGGTGGIGVPSVSSIIGGGGGAGGVLTFTGPTLALAAGTYPIGVGTGGGPQFSPYNGDGTSGGNTTISSPTAILLTAVGGGGGAFNTQYPVPGNPREGQPGGSGGGGGGPNPTDYRQGGDGTPGQGFPGGAFNNSPGGGGGAGGAGSAGSYTPGTSTSGGDGGPGTPVPAFNLTALQTYTIPLIPTTSINAIGPTGMYGGGGGGTAYDPGFPQNIGGSGGAGGGGDGGYKGNSAGENGINFTGGGGGGNAYPGPTTRTRGGDGVLMIRYETPAP